MAFDSKGGSTVPAQRIAKNGLVTEPDDPTKTGYTFDEWDKGDTEYDFSTPVTSNFVLDAKWTINEYTVTFDSDGGSAVTAQTVEYGSKATEPSPAPTKSDYTFGGWYSDAELTTAFDFNTAIVADTTLYAKWTTP